jgi:hypothetical protein
MGLRSNIYHYLSNPLTNNFEAIIGFMIPIEYLWVIV